MKFSIRSLFSVLACAFAFIGSVQAQDNYVYETDELDCSTLGVKVETKVYDTSSIFNSVNYGVVCRCLNGTFGFEVSEPLTGLVTLSTKGFVKSVKVEYGTQQNSTNSSLGVFMRNSAYVRVSDLYDDNSRGVLLGECTESNNVVSSNGDYKYFGLKSNYAVYVSKIIVEWQLAHIRDNLTVGNLGTICLPYDVKAEDWSEELTVYTLAGKIMEASANQDKVKSLVFEEVREIKAGIPYLFVAKKPNLCLKYFGTGVTTAGNSKGFYGSFENREFTAADCSENDIFLVSQNTIRLAGEGAGVGANRAYIKMGEVPVYGDNNSSRKLLLSADGYVETGLTPTIAEKTKVTNSKDDAQNQVSSSYDLQGRHIGIVPASGIILQNGRKKFIDAK